LFCLESSCCKPAFKSAMMMIILLPSSFVTCMSAVVISIVHSNNKIICFVSTFSSWILDSRIACCSCYLFLFFPSSKQEGVCCWAMKQCMGTSTSTSSY
jgi:hypothetical protein